MKLNLGWVKENVKFFLYKVWQRQYLGILATTIFITGSVQMSLAYPAPKDDRVADEKWTQDATVQNVTFYHRIVECNGETVLLLKFDNKNRAAVNVSWINAFEVSDTKGAYRIASPTVSRRQITIAPGISAASTCTDENSKNLIINAKDIDPTHHIKITNFEYKNLTINNF